MRGCEAIIKSPGFSGFPQGGMKIPMTGGQAPRVVLVWPTSEIDHACVMT
jgi:hypothetical protein